MTTKTEAHMRTLDTLIKLRPFIGRSQEMALRDGMRGEEREFFYTKVAEVARTVEKMPGTHGQDGLGDAAIVHLHYFTGGADWYITERDSAEDGEGQAQAFGLADLFHDGGELGYISLPEVLSVGAELDLYWEPVTLARLRQGRAAQLTAASRSG